MVCVWFLLLFSVVRLDRLLVVVIILCSILWCSVSVVVKVVCVGVW